MQTRLIYLGGPYTHPSRLVMQTRFKTLTIIAGRLAHKGLFIFSPVTHGHQIEYYARPKISYKYYVEHGIEMLSRCDALYIACIKGWELSRGLGAEILEAHRLAIPALYLDPKTCTTHEEPIPYVDSKRKTNRGDTLYEEEDSTLGLHRGK